jgi:DNA replication ATP-dependent helicase Dna2
MLTQIDVNIAYGILWNMETNKMSRIQGIRHLIRPLIMRRNELANWVRERSVLPPVLKEYRFCETCKVRDPCFAFHKLVEGGDGSSFASKAKEKFDDFVKYLQPAHAEFFMKWQTLLSKEEADMMKFRKEIWTLLSKERERLGRAFSSVVIEPGSYHESHEGSKINKHRYTFVKSKHTPGFSFSESQLVVGEPIVISDENGHYYLAKGFVTSVHKRRITVTIDRALHNARRKKEGFDTETNQVFAGITELISIAEMTQLEEAPVVYRIDKDEFENGMGIPRNNLVQLMNDGVYKSIELRSLIVDGKQPTFQALPASRTIDDGPLNSDQQAAIRKVLTAKDCALILGMPGTGKTTTIAHLIRALVAEGKSILLTSFQHNAVDTILLKLKNDKIPILRLGSATKVHPQVRDFAILAETQKSSLEELEQSWMNPPIVAATCLKIDHPIFTRRIFDYCIVDEASQITLPTCLGPIRMARTFVLVGDHHQLPPLVRNKDAQNGGLDVSLFKLLSENCPEAVVNLEHQYRMAADVMYLANELIYAGKLKCGTAAVAQQTLSIPDPAALSQLHYTTEPTQSSSPSSPFQLCGGPAAESCYLARVLRPEHRTIFLSTDGLANTSLEVVQGNSNRITNPFEAIVLPHICAALLASGVPASEIGIITPFRSQLSLLKTSLSDTLGSENAASIELNTADKYQGRDKACILVSFVRNNSKGDVGELLRDERRINVAITRAKAKLVLVGSKSTLAKGSDLLNKMVGLCETRGWVKDLKPGDIDGHCITSAVVTQSQTQIWQRFNAFKSSEKTRKALQSAKDVEEQLEGSLSPVMTPETAMENRRKAVIDLTEDSPTKTPRLHASQTHLSNPVEPVKQPLEPVESASLNTKASQSKAPVSSTAPKVRRPLQPIEANGSFAQSTSSQSKVLKMKKPNKHFSTQQSSLMQLWSQENNGKGGIIRDLINDAI